MFAVIALALVVLVVGLVAEREFGHVGQVAWVLVALLPFRAWLHRRN